MARRKKVTSKQCAMTGMTFPTNEFGVTMGGTCDLTVAWALAKFVDDFATSSHVGAV